MSSAPPLPGSRAYWQQAAREVYRRIPPLLARFGVAPDPHLRLVQDTTVDFSYYDAEQVTVSLSLPDVTDFRGRLYWMVLTAAIGAESTEAAVAFAHWQLPYLAGHEMGHHLRHRYDAYTGDHWLEEHVANAIGFGVAALFPEFRSGLAAMAPLAQAAARRLAPLGGAHLPFGHRDLEEALVALGLVPEEDLAAARHLARAAGTTVMAVLQASGLDRRAVDQAAAGRAAAAGHLDSTYLSNLMEYAAFHLNWFADLLRQPEPPDLGSVLAEHILGAGWEQRRHRAVLWFLRRAVAADDALAPAAALALVRDAGPAAAPALLAHLRGRPPRVQAGLLRALTPLPPERAALDACRELLHTEGGAALAARGYLLRHEPAALAALARHSPAWAALGQLAEPETAPAGRQALRRALQHEPARTLAALHQAATAAPERLEGAPLGRWLLPLAAHSDPVLSTAALQLLAHPAVPRARSRQQVRVVAACALSTGDGGRRAALAALGRLPEGRRRAWLTRLLVEAARAAARAGTLAAAARQHAPAGSRLLWLLEDARAGLVECGLHVAAALAGGAGQAAVEAALAEGTNEAVAWAHRLLAVGVPAAARPVLHRLLNEAPPATAALDAGEFWPAAAAFPNPLVQAAASMEQPGEAAAGAPVAGSGPGQAPAADMFARIDQLRAAPLLAGMKAGELAPLAAAAHELALQPGDVLFRAGHRQSALFLPMSGRIELLDAAGGHCGHLEPGQTFGDVTLLDREPLPCTGRCLTPARVLRLEAAAFEALCLQEPGVLLRLGLQLARRLRKAPAAAATDPHAAHGHSHGPHAARSHGAARPSPPFTAAEKLAHLAGLPLLRACEPEVLAPMLDAFVTLDYRDGAVIASAGAGDPRLWLVARGHVVLEVPGREARLGPGASFGEVALLDGQPQPWTAAAAGDCRLLALPREDFLALARRSPAVLLALVHGLARRLAHTAG